MREPPQVLIVGAGPVGLTMAVELMRHGVACRIVDKAAERTDKSKALVLWPRTLELLDRAGAVDPFITAGIRVVRGRIFANREPLAELRLEGVPTPYPFALMLPQSETERLLDAHLRRLGAAVERSVELRDFTARDRGVSAHLQHRDGRIETAESGWLLGCDGAHSAVRHGLGMDFSGDALPIDWLLADVRIDGPLEPAVLRLDWHASGILAFFPIGPDRFRVIADGGPAIGERPRDPTLADVQQVVDERGPGGLRIHDPVWLSGFRINERKVDAYRRGRVFLAGDAAHIHSPAGGQGMNTGMQDAFNLAWKLALVVRGRGGEALLDSYSRERSAVGDEVLRNAGAMTRLATLRRPAAQHIRNTLVPLLASMGFVQTRMRETLTELAISYRHSPLSRDDRPLSLRLRAHAVAAGDRAPDAAVVDTRSGTVTRLFALCRTTRHCLLLCAGMDGSGDGRAALDALGATVRRARADLVDTFLVATWPADGRSETPLLIEVDGSLCDAYAVRKATAVLIRPDGYAFPRGIFAYVSLKYFVAAGGVSKWRAPLSEDRQRGGLKDCPPRPHM
jgi:2-polyprenyl-6-methoxyphenol hydroxylase-like FAD-dependent oxidoreductase